MLCYIAFDICIHFNTYAKNVTCFEFYVNAKLLWIICDPTPTPTIAPSNGNPLWLDHQLAATWVTKLISYKPFYFY